MRALLIQHGCELALEVLPEDMEAQAKAELNKKAYSAVILCLGNKVLREVTEETTAAGVWTKLETFYMTREESNVGIHVSQAESQDQSPERLCLIGSWIHEVIPHDTQVRFIFDFLECDGGSVLLGDNRECKIRGIGKSSKVKLINGFRVVLSETRRDNFIYSLAGHAAAGARKAGSVWQEEYSCSAYSYVKQGKVEPKAVKCVLLGYHEGVKGYRLYRLDDESPKIFTSRNVVFNEGVMYKDTLKDSSAGNDKSVEELQVEVELQRLNNHTLEEDKTAQEDGDDEDAGDQETDQKPNLTDYHSIRDREPRTRTKPLRFQYESNMAAYTATTDKEDAQEPLTYQEAVAYEDKQVEIGSTKSLLKKKFDMKELEEAKKILGMEIFRDRSRKILSVSQSEYVSKILINFRIDNGKSVQIPLGGHFKLSLKDCSVRDCDV
nr:zinc finger, CCHC-type [Tanacetum cinerariifolium]